MNCQIKGLLIFFAILSNSRLEAQHTDNIIDSSSVPGKFKINYSEQPIKGSLHPKSLVIPGLMIAYGFTCLESHGLKDWNREIREEVWQKSPHKKVHIDNFLQFAPAVAVYGLNMAGIQGRNNLRDRSMIYLLSNIICNASVYSLKNITDIQRPDGTKASFPSGHTAEAFASAEFLRQEYKGVSPWYGIAGYAMAATTGYLRIYNNKHWLSDVVAGAGVGIASTKIAYWLYPTIKQKLFKTNKMNAVVAPYYSNKTGGLTMVYNFR